MHSRTRIDSRIPFYGEPVELVLWCNGSTTVFGTVCSGSNPAGTTLFKSLAVQGFCFSAFREVRTLLHLWYIFLNMFLSKKNNVLKSRKTFDLLCVETIEILSTIQATITDETDVVWAGFNNVTELKEVINNCIGRVNKSDITVFSELHLLFAPTGRFQELSISNGWGQEFLNIAAQYDNIYADLISF